MQWCI